MTTYGSVCSGIEGASVAWHHLGWQPSWFAEIEKFPSAVLAHRYPSVINLGDMTGIPWMLELGAVVAPDVLVGGTPCQSFSVAGLRAGLHDARGQLTYTFVEIADEIDRSRSADGLDPCVVVWENVPGVLSDKTNAFGCFLAGLCGEDEELFPSGKKWTNAGCVFGSQRTVAWRIIDAQFFGLAQRRRRVFVVASARNGFDPAEVLFEFDGVRRDTPPSREAGQSVTGTISARTSAGGGLGTDLDLDGGLQPVGFVQNQRDEVRVVDVAGALAAQPGVKQQTYLAQPMAFSRKDHGADAGSVSPTLRSMGHDGSHANGGGQVAVAIRTAQTGSNGWGIDENTAYTLDLASGQAVCASKSVAWSLSSPRGGTGYTAKDVDVSQALTTTSSPDCNQGGNVIQQAMQVRRLLPIECEKLQGFPDDWTLVPVGKKLAADGNRYKTLGNSFAVNCVRWIGERIDAELTKGSELI